MKQTRFWLTTIVMLLSFCKGVAIDFSINGICYNIISSSEFTVEVTGSNNSYGYSGHIEIPNKVEYNGEVYRVTAIGRSAFWDCSGLRSITIPNSVNVIGGYAFGGSTTGLSSVHISSIKAWCNIERPYVGSNPLSKTCKLYLNGELVTELVIPDSVTVIKDHAFSNCYSLVSLTIPESVTRIGHSVFSQCTALRKVVIEDGSNVLSLGCNNYNSAYYTTGDGLFYDCPLDSVYLGRILNYSSSSSYGYSPFYKEGRFPIISLGDDIASINDNLFYENPYLDSFIVPDGVNSIGRGAFYGCSNLTSITIPEGVENIGNDAFYGCSKLVDVYANNIDSWCKINFSNTNANPLCYATNLYINGVKMSNDLIIPNSVTSVNSYAFYGLTNLNSVLVGNGVLSIGNNIFSTSPKKTIWLTNTPPTGYTNAKGSINYVANDQYTRLGNVQVYPYLSSMFEADGVKYVPVSPSERTCHAIDCAYDSTAEIINVSETTSFKGVAMKVTEVMPYTFYGNNHITEVSVSHLGHIGDYAFYNCDSIKTVNVSNQGNIGSQVFYDCDGIESVNVANLGDIGNQVFYDCDGIKDVNISNLGNIGSQVFYNSDAIESVTISNHGDIGEKAFYDCNGIKIIDVQNRGIVGAQAFYGCNAMETAIVANCIPTPSSIDDTPQTLADWTSTNKSHSSTSSNTYTFTAKDGAVLSFDWWVSSESGYDKLIVTLDGSTILEKSGSLSGTYSNAVSQGEHTLIVKYTKDSSQSSGSDQAKVSNIVISKGSNEQTIAGVGSEAFFGCSSLKTVTLGDSIGSLGNKAFYQCTSLQEIVIPDSVKAVGEYCFSGCSAMKSAIIGDGVGSIATYTFQDCTTLEDVEIGDGVTTISNSAFTGCLALTNVELGNSVATINNYAFLNCSSLPEISIPQSTTTIGDYVFGGCSQLADVIIEDRTTELSLGSNGSSSLFADCPLDSVYIGGKITYNTTSSKGYSPFYRNTSLRTVVITDREEQIYANEFYGCTNLQNVTIGNGVKSIGDYAFSGCCSLEGFSFGSNMETIGAEAFSDCTRLTNITSHAAVPPTCGTQALDDINKWSCTLRVPSGYASAYQGADQWKEFFFVDDVVEVAKYTLTFMVDGEVCHTSSLVHNAEITIPDAPTKEGYTFSGWNEVPETMPAEDVVFNGFFTINKYLVTFKIGDEVISSESLEYGANIVVPVVPEKKGHSFNGWGEVAKTVPAGDLTYEGSYSVNSYLLTYMVDGEIVQSDSIAYGTKLVTPKAPTKEGHTFSGWEKVPATMPAEDVVISGSFAVNTYKVYYYVGDVLVHTAEVAYGEAIPEYVYEPTTEGDIFEGWVGENHEIMPAHDVVYIANITNGISLSTLKSQESVLIYDLQGRRVLDTENLKGMYIINGKKVVYN